MKLLIATPYFSPKVGGLENYALNMALELKKLGWEVVVVCGDHVDRVQENYERGLKIYRLPIQFTVSNTPVNFRWYGMIRRILRTERPDVVNAHTPVPFMADMAVLAARSLPVAVTYHAATLAKPGSMALRLATRMYQVFEHLTIGRARLLVAVSPYVEAALRARFQKPTEVVYNAVALGAPAATTKQRRGLVFVANLEPAHTWKGLDLILEALALTAAAGRPVQPLTVIGDGSSRARYEARVKELGLTAWVSFKGRLTGTARDRGMAEAAGLIAYPTTANDAFPTVFLEAWALGLPVIAAAIGPIPGLIEPGQTGLLVAPEDPAALSEAIETAIRSPQALAKMGERGRKLIETEYNWPMQAAKMSRLLESLV